MQIRMYHQKKVLFVGKMFLGTALHDCAIVKVTQCCTAKNGLAMKGGKPFMTEVVRIRENFLAAQNSTENTELL